MNYLVSDDTTSTVRATLTRNDTGAVIPLTDHTVVMKVRLKGSTTVLFTLTGVGTAEQLAAGIIEFDFSSNLGIVAGYYEGEIQITYASTEIETVYEVVPFHVRTDF